MTSGEKLLAALLRKARMDAEYQRIALCWTRGVCLRLWGENRCEPVAITCPDGEVGQLDYSFGDDAEDRPRA